MCSLPLEAVSNMGLLGELSFLVEAISDTVSDSSDSSALKSCIDAIVEVRFADLRVTFLHYCIELEQCQHQLV